MFNFFNKPEIYSISYYDIYKNKKIGKGSYSEVYLGKCKNKEIINKYQLNTDTVAIKKINNNTSTKINNMIKEEITIMKKIIENPHSSIIKCIEVIDDIDSIYIIMEYCENGELINILGSPIEETMARYYFKQLYEGLIYLNNNKIIHRDIKPKNLLLKSNSKEIKIADFGLAKIYSGLTRINTVCGSPLYMAPEILGEKSYSHTADIWSLGLILYELIYGYNPYKKCNDMDELKDEMLKKEITYPKIKMSNECEDILKKLLDKNESTRIKLHEINNHPWMMSVKNNIIYDSDEEIYETKSKPIKIIRK